LDVPQSLVFRLILGLGIDEGLISRTLSKTHFIKLLGLGQMTKVELANVKGNISAMMQMGSVGGAALFVSYFPMSAVLTDVGLLFFATV
jgi:hypothetical protein